MPHQTGSRQAIQIDWYSISNYCRVVRIHILFQMQNLYYEILSYGLQTQNAQYVFVCKIINPLASEILFSSNDLIVFIFLYR